MTYTTTRHLTGILDECVKGWIIIYILLIGIYIPGALQLDQVVIEWTSDLLLTFNRSFDHTVRTGDQTKTDRKPNCERGAHQAVSICVGFANPDTSKSFSKLVCVARHRT